MDSKRRHGQKLFDNLLISKHGTPRVRLRTYLKITQRKYIVIMVRTSTQRLFLFYFLFINAGRQFYYYRRNRLY